MANLTVDLLTFQNSLVDPGNWPKLSCAAANQLALEVSSLRLDGTRELVFRDSGQIRCFDDHHRLVFNRPALRLELHEQGDISFLTGGPPPVERMVILANGNVGIGVANPGAPLEVAGFIRTAQGVESNAATKMQIGTRLGQPLELITANTAALTVAANGNVGISTANPQARLQVTDGAIMPAVGNSSQAGIQFPPNPGGGSGDEAFIRYFATAGETSRLMIGVGNDADDAIVFRQAGDERMTIINGNVGIGTGTPGQTLHVEGSEILSTGGGAGFKFRNRGSATNADDWVWYSEGNVARFWRAGVGDLMNVTTDGDVNVRGRIGTNGFSAAPKLAGWGGGIHTWDLEAEGTIWSANGIDASPHDLAENYYSDQSLRPGDVVCLDRERARIVWSERANDALALGVISTKPGVLLNADHEPETKDLFPVALCGRVPCKVTDENGPIHRGDLLTTAPTPGHAMKARPALISGQEYFRPGTIIGKALEPHEAGKGVIEIFVALR